MEYSLSSSLVGGSGSINPDALSLDLQFATDKTLTARRGPTPVFTRASTGTFVGSNGLVQSAAINVARFDHDTSYVGSSVYVTSSNAAGNTGLQLPSQRVYFSGIDGNGYPEFISDIYYISFSSGQWILDGDGGNFQAHANTILSDEYVTDVGTGFVTVVLTLACKGLLIEEQRSNLVFPSEALTTQTRTVTAVAHALSFYGTGTIVLSGAHIATVTGTGAFPTRTTLTFTPSAGSLILTVTGTVTQAQLEVGSFATSYIPTVDSSLTRSADVCSISGANFTGFAKQGEGSVVVHGDSYQGTTPSFCQFSNDANGARSFTFLRNVSTGALEYNDSGSGMVTVSASPSFPVKFGAGRNQAGGVGTFYNGTSGAGSVFTTNGAQTKMLIGNSAVGSYLNGCIRSIKHYKKRLSAAKMQALTAP